MCWQEQETNLGRLPSECLTQTSTHRSHKISTQNVVWQKFLSHRMWYDRNVSAMNVSYSYKTSLSKQYLPDNKIDLYIKTLKVSH